MKKNLFLLIVAMLAMPAMFAQTKNVARECVLFELLTGVYCGQCPEADAAIEYMMNQGMAIAPVCYQDPFFSEPELYTNEVSNRVNYYNNIGCPDLFVDGLTEVLGCAGNTYYVSYYQNRIGVESPFTIGMNLESVGGNMYKVNCHVEQVGECTASDLRVFIVLTQDHHPYSWSGGPELNNLVRDMIPNEQGTPFVGPVFDFSEEFEINYPLENCHLIAWVQNYTNPREVFQAVMMETEVSAPETLTFDVDTLWINENWADVNIFNNTDTEIVTINKIAVDDDMDWFTFECNGQEFDLNEEVSIEIPRGESVTLRVNLNMVAKEMKYPVLMFDNTLETVSLVTAFDWVDAVADNEKQKAQVFPNPSKGSFNLNLGEGQWNVEVYDITGRKVYGGRHEGQSAIDLSQSPKGMYFLKAKNESEEITTKVVIR